MPRFFLAIAILSLSSISLFAQSCAGMMTEKKMFQFYKIERSYQQPLVKYNTQAPEVKKKLYEDFLKKHQSCGNDSSVNAAILEGDCSKLKTLLAQGADGRACDKNGITPLRCAVLLGEAECAKILYLAGARLTDPVPQGVTFPEKFNLTDVVGYFTLAVLYDNADLMKVLLEEEGEKVKKDVHAFKSVLASVIARGSSEVLQPLLEAGKELPDKNEVYTNVTFKALYESFFIPIRLDKILKLLSVAGLNVSSARFHNKETLLHAVACSDDVYPESNIRELIKAGANLGARDASGKTPLHSAVENENVQSARALILAGASISAFDFNLRTPLKSVTALGTAHGKTFQKRFTHALIKKVFSALIGDVGDLWSIFVTDYSPVIKLLTESGADPLEYDLVNGRALKSMIWRNDFDHIIAFLSGGLRLDDSLRKKIDCFDELRKLGKCFQISDIPSTLRPDIYFIEQRPVCLNVCSNETLLLDRCITANTPVIDRYEMYSLVLLLTFPLLVDFLCFEGKCSSYVKPFACCLVAVLVMSTDFMDW